MNKRQEKLLVAMLCGLIMVSAGAFAVQPAMAKNAQPVFASSVQHVSLHR
ncbi:hypothetical protein SAMN05428969_0872 [Devosia sp. YR412]|nr:hypothetical protein [Devosia sp. YR412]SEP78008.1 hypothetical protein SAMN05428969_0872 [Devosia sp. YR412]